MVHTPGAEIDRLCAGGGGAPPAALALTSALLGVPRSVQFTPTTRMLKPTTPAPAYGLEAAAELLGRCPVAPGRESPAPVGMKSAAGPATIARCTGSGGAPAPEVSNAESHTSATSATASPALARTAKVPPNAGKGETDGEGAREGAREGEGVVDDELDAVPERAEGARVVPPLGTAGSPPQEVVAERRSMPASSDATPGSTPAAATAAPATPPAHAAT